MLKVSGGSKERRQKGGGFRGGQVDVSLHTPHRASTLHAAFYFLSQNATISSCDCSYAIAPATLGSLLALLQSSHGVSKLKLTGARTICNEEVPQALVKIISGSNNSLRRLYLVRLFGDEAPLKPVIPALAQCEHLSCDLPLLLLCRFARFSKVHLSVAMTVTMYQVLDE